MNRTPDANGWQYQPLGPCAYGCPPVMDACPDTTFNLVLAEALGAWLGKDHNPTQEER